MTSETTPSCTTARTAATTCSRSTPSLPTTEAVTASSTSRTRTTASRQSGLTAALLEAAAVVTRAPLLLRGERTAGRRAVAPVRVGADRRAGGCALPRRALLRGGLPPRRQRGRDLDRRVGGDPLVHDPPRRVPGGTTGEHAEVPTRHYLEADL